MAKRSAQGAGSIRERKDGLWEARYTVGRNPATGKQVRKSVYGKTQQEVRKKLTAITSDLDNGVFIEPSKLTFGNWLKIWLDEYCGSIKPRTKSLYENCIEYRIKPFLGSVKLQKLKPAMIQKFYNDALNGKQDNKKAISPKTVKNLHGIVHKALQQAVEIGYIKLNPAAVCVLPKVQKAKINPMDEQQTKLFIKAISNEPLRRLFLVALFTGMREGEVIGLTWDNVDLKNGTIHITQQLQRHDGEYKLMPPKNSKFRLIVPAPYIMDILKEEQTAQKENRLKAGPLWENKKGFVFTNAIGGHYSQQYVHKKFKNVVQSIEMPGLRFHDLRHTYAVAAIRAGDDIKTVSENLGHASVAFTLDIYGHVTDEMRQSSAERMQAYIDRLQA